MKDGRMITQLVQADSVADDSMYIVEMGDGTGTKSVTHENLVKSIRPQFEESEDVAEEALENIKSGKPLPDILKNIKSFCKGVITLGKVLKTAEEINANTSPNMIAGALAVKELYNQLNSNLLREYYQVSIQPNGGSANLTYKGVSLASNRNYIIHLSTIGTSTYQYRRYLMRDNIIRIIDNIVPANASEYTNIPELRIVGGVANVHFEGNKSIIPYNIAVIIEYLG